MSMTATRCVGCASLNIDTLTDSHALWWFATDQRIALLGAEQSLFEASMYTFVFLWTPALSPNGEKIPHGEAKTSQDVVWIHRSLC